MAINHCNFLHFASFQPFNNWSEQICWRFPFWSVFLAGGRCAVCVYRSIQSDVEINFNFDLYPAKLAHINATQPTVLLLWFKKIRRLDQRNYLELIQSQITAYTNSVYLISFRFTVILNSIWLEIIAWLNNSPVMLKAGHYFFFLSLGISFDSTWNGFSLLFRIEVIKEQTNMKKKQQ